MSVKCGHCKGYHDGVDGVRLCANGYAPESQVAGGSVRQPTPGTLAAQGCIKGQVCNCPPSYSSCYLYREGGTKPTSRPGSRSQSHNLPDVPAGRYAVDLYDELKFFKIDRPTSGRWAGYTFVKMHSSDDLRDVRGARAKHVLELIAKDPEEAMLRFGREIGSCGHCGRTLTDAESRARGIGPVCAGKITFG